MSMRVRNKNRFFPLMEYCATCLSSDRRLILMKNVRHIILTVKLFRFQLDVRKHYVCWECKGIFNKINNFRRQILVAQRRMQNWHERNVVPKILRQNRLKSLSQLAVMDTVTFEKLPEVESKDEIEEAMEKMFDESNENANGTTIEAPDQDKELMEFTEEHLEENSQYSDDNDYEVDYIEDWDSLTEVKEDGKDDCVVNDENIDLNDVIDSNDDISLLIVDNDVKETEDCSQDGTNCNGDGVSDEDFDIYNIPYYRLTKEESNFHISHMSLDEVYQTRNEDRKAAVYTRCSYKCVKCITGYYQEKRFGRHLTLRHDFVFNGKQRNFKCSICESRFTRKCFLKAHYERHFRRYTCKNCDFSHHKLNVMFLHLLRVHKEGTSHVCKTCDMEFDRRHTLDWHIKSQHKENPKCEVCGKTFSSRSNLNTHMAVHVPPKNVQCPECSRWVRESNFEVHRRQHEAENNTTYCQVCDQTFTSMALYKRHVARSSRHKKNSK